MGSSAQTTQPAIMKVFIALSALVAASLAAPAAPPAYGAEPAYPDEPALYTYQYAVKDDYTNNNFGTEEKRDGYAAQGSYYVSLLRAWRNLNSQELWNNWKIEIENK